MADQFIRDSAEFYERLYAFAANRAEEYSCSLVLPCSAFVQGTQQHPNAPLFSELKDLVPREFVFAMFWLLFNRAPEEKAVSYWLQYADKTSASAMMNRLRRAPALRMEARLRQVVFAEEYFPSLNDVNCAVPGRFPWLRARLDKALLFCLHGSYRVYAVTLRPLRVYLRKRRA